MRLKTLALSATLALAAVSLSAKTFEGIVTYQSVRASGDDGQTLRILISGGKWRVEPQGQRGGMGAMIIDPKAHSMLMLMTEKKKYMKHVWEPKTAKGAAAAKPTMHKTGKSETIAGYKADEWEISSAGKTSSIWVTKELGTMAFSMDGGPQGGGQGMEIPEELKNSGFFPLRMQGHGDKAGKLEATKVEPQSLDASLFQAPSDYSEMKGMGGGMGMGGGEGMSPEAMSKMKQMSPEQLEMLKKMMKGK